MLFCYCYSVARQMFISWNSRSMGSRDPTSKRDGKRRHGKKDNTIKKNYGYKQTIRWNSNNWFNLGNSLWSIWLTRIIVLKSLIGKSLQQQTMIRSHTNWPPLPRPQAQYLWINEVYLFLPSFRSLCVATPNKQRYIQFTRHTQARLTISNKP